MAMDAAGDAATVWSDDAALDVKAAGLDVAGPRLSSLSVPASGTAGAASSFAATAVDTWSQVADVVWSFGDGATVSGATTTHTCTAAGTYAVTVTVTDRLATPPRRHAPSRSERPPL